MIGLLSSDRQSQSLTSSQEVSGPNRAVAGPWPASQSIMCRCLQQNRGKPPL